MRVDEFLERSAAAAPDKTAVVAHDDRITYGELLARVERVAAALRGPLGVRRGDRVLILMDSGIECVTAIYGALRAGAVFVVTHPTTTGHKLHYLLENAGATCLVTDHRHLHKVTPALAALPDLRSIVVVGAKDEPAQVEGVATFSFEALLDEAPPAPRRDHISTDLAALIYTSGSTGAPKGVMMTHANIDAASGSIITYLENTADDVVLNVLPLSFDYGLYQVLMALRFGGTIVLERSMTFVHDVLTRAVKERVTGLPVVPTIAAMLLSHDLGKYDLSALRYVTNTAAALPVEHIRRLRDAFPQARLFSMYGLTECKRVAYLPPEQLDARPSSVGVAIPDTEAWVQTDDGRRAAPGEIGELVVRGPHVMLGYWRNEEATNKRLTPGALPREALLHTGDLFKTDDEGFLYFVGRTDDIIKSGGEKVAPREIEDVLYSLPAVGAAAVVGVPDELLGQRIRAYVAPAAGKTIDERAVLTHCRAHLEDLLVPHEVVIRESLPVSGSGKIDKLALQVEGEGRARP